MTQHARLVTLAVILSLTACVSPSPPRLWEKEGATPETTGNDLVACQQAAHQEAINFGYGGFSRFGPYFGYRRFYSHSRRHPHPPAFRPGPSFRHGPFFWRGPYYWGPHYWGPYYWGPSGFDREIQLTTFCMHIKGYELVPVPPAPSQQVPTRAPGLIPEAAPEPGDR